jgi:regulator of sigma E protease
MSLLIFLCVLGLLIIVHEWGHFISAKVLGIKVEKFSIGFGPKLFSKTVNGTNFMVSAVPLGGYVKLAGDERPECKGNPDEFFSHPVWHRAIVVVMGPVVNFIFAYLCFFFLFSVTGYPILDNRIGEVLPGYPAYEAGFQAGDRVVKINDDRIGKWVELQVLIFESQGKALNFTLQRGQQEILVSNVTPIFETTVVEGHEKKYPVVGLKPQLQKYGIGQSLIEAGKELWSIIAMTADALYKIVTGAESARDKLAGPIRIFDVVKDAAHMGFAYLIFIVGVISASLGFFNLFPIPVLDGGHLLFFVIEGVRGRPLPAKVEDGFMRVGFSLLICLMVFVVYNDIVHMGWMDKGFRFFSQIFK